jgi:hypothetical protein
VTAEDGSIIQSDDSCKFIVSESTLNQKMPQCLTRNNLRWADPPSKEVLPNVKEAVVLELILYVKKTEGVIHEGRGS